MISLHNSPVPLRDCFIVELNQEYRAGFELGWKDRNVTLPVCRLTSRHILHDPAFAIAVLWLKHDRSTCTRAINRQFRQLVKYAG